MLTAENNSCLPLLPLESWSGGYKWCSLIFFSIPHLCFSPFHQSKSCSHVLKIKSKNFSFNLCSTSLLHIFLDYMRKQIVSSRPFFSVCVYVCNFSSKPSCDLQQVLSGIPEMKSPCQASKLHICLSETASLEKGQWLFPVLALLSPRDLCLSCLCDH